MNGRCQAFYCGAAVSALFGEARFGQARARCETGEHRGVDVLVVGAGPAGLTAAAELRRLGVPRVLVADREAAPGGIPRHSWHTGYGLRDLHRVLSGPAYARALADAATRSGAELRTGCTVTELEPAATRCRPC